MSFKQNKNQSWKQIYKYDARKQQEHKHIISQTDALRSRLLHTPHIPSENRYPMWHTEELEYKWGMLKTKRNIKYE